MGCPQEANNQGLSEEEQLKISKIIAENDRLRYRIRILQRVLEEAEKNLAGAKAKV